MFWKLVVTKSKVIYSGSRVVFGVFVVQSSEPLAHQTRLCSVLRYFSKNLGNWLCKFHAQYLET